MRVVDFTHVLAGPYATMLLAELGADVIKVERPGHGDETRGWGPPFLDEESAYFHAVNRGKRSIAVDLREEDGQETVRRLVSGADIVIENFKPGVTERLGIDYETLSVGNPLLIYASITGFGSRGPLAATPGTEVIVEARSGLMDITGEADGPPVRFGVAMVDLATGIATTSGVLAALLERGRTGRGRRLEFSLFATALSTLGTVITGATADGDRRDSYRWGTGHPSIVPYAAYGTRDGAVVIGAVNDPMWTRLTAALDLDVPDHWSTNDRRVAERAAVDAVVERALASRGVDDVVALLEAQGVLVAPVSSVVDALESEQARALGIVFADRGALFARSVLDFASGPQLTPAPALGEHTDELREELGLPIDAGTVDPA